MPKPSPRTNITVTLFDKSGKQSTTMVSHDRLYAGRSDSDINSAERWAKGVCDRIYGK